MCFFFTFYVFEGLFSGSGCGLITRRVLGTRVVLERGAAPSRGSCMQGTSLGRGLRGGEADQLLRQWCGRGRLVTNLLEPTPWLSLNPQASQPAAVVKLNICVTILKHVYFLNLKSK